MPLNLNDLLPQVTIAAINCPDNTARLYLRDAARKFARDSLLWDVRLGSTEVMAPDDYDTPIIVPVPSPADDADPDFTLPTNPSGVIVLITRVTLDNEAPPEGFDEPFSYDKVTQELKLSPRWVTNAGTIEVWAALQPVRDTSTVPDIFDEWEEAIRLRALHDLLMMPGRDWSDTGAAARYNREYSIQVNRASARRAQGQVSRNLHSDPIPFL